MFLQKADFKNLQALEQGEWQEGNKLKLSLHYQMQNSLFKFKLNSILEVRTEQ